MGREPGAREFDNDSILISSSGKPARAVMDAAAARVGARWEHVKAERDREAGYMLLVPSRELDEVFLPKTEAWREMNRIGSRMLAAIDGLPKEDRDRVLSGQALPFDSIPADLQSLSRDLMHAYVAHRNESGRPFSGVTDDFGERTPFQIKMKPRRGFRNAWVSIQMPGGGTGVSLNDYEETKLAAEAARRQKQRPGERDPLYDPRHNRMTQAEAKALPELKKPVSLNLADATFPDVLASLHRRYGVNFVSDRQQDLPQRANVKLGPIPLGEALDRLTEIYKETEWEWRKYGFLVVRGPKNPAREKKAASAP